MPTDEEVKNVTQKVVQLALELQDDEDLEKLVRKIIEEYLELAYIKIIDESKGEE